MATSMQPKKAEGMTVSMTRLERARIVRIEGDFTAPDVDELRGGLEDELKEGNSIIFDLSSTTTIWPDAAGFLARLMRKRVNSDGQVWLAGVRPTLQTVLHTTFPAGHNLRIAATVGDVLSVLRIEVAESSAGDIGDTVSVERWPS
jgi:anti-anti-sigma regulatory factor